MYVYPILEKEGRKVGVCRLNLETGYFGMLVIYKQFRGKGYAHELIKLVVETAKKYGIDTIWCHIQDPTIKRMYEKHEFYELEGVEIRDLVNSDEGKILYKFLGESDVRS